MLARAFMVAVLLACGLYVLGVVATTTPYFADRQRQRRILLRSILIFASIALTVATLAFIIAVERH
jgi:ABC-type lipoprotein release transport system permease subunit